MFINLLALISLVNSQSSPTFYFRVGDNVPLCPEVQTFNDGMSYGPCNGGQGVKYNSGSKYWVAISDAKSHCGQQITARYKESSITLTVMDECPGCAGDNHLDMSLEALIELTGSAAVACAIGLPPPIITWEFSGSQPVQQPFQETVQETVTQQIDQQPVQQPDQQPIQQPDQQPVQQTVQQIDQPQETVDVTSYPSYNGKCRTIN